MKIQPLFGPYGSSALPYVDQFETYGANAFWFHGFDPQAFQACQTHSIAACVEFKTFRADFSQHPELIPIGVDGKPIRYGHLVQGVCLSQKDFLEETETHLKEGLLQYQPAGVWLDYLTYGGWFETPAPDLQESCFCPDCIAEFCNATGIDAGTPHEILKNHQSEWTAHKCDRVAGFAKHYAEIIRAMSPEAIIGAYMCPWTPQEFNGALSRIFAQDYLKIAPAIDIFTPLIYAKKSGRNNNWGKQFLDQAGSFVPTDRKVLLILDALDFPDSLQEAAQAENPSYGIQLFSGAEIFSDPAKAKVFHQAVSQIQAQIHLNQEK